MLPRSQCGHRSRSSSRRTSFPIADRQCGHFASGRNTPAPRDPAAVDQFCESLRANGTALSVVYFCEWVNYWLMGDRVPGPGAVEGRKYQAACLSPAAAIEWADTGPREFQEDEWFDRQLRQAADAWAPIARPAVVVVARRVLGGSATDDEVRAALQGVPQWLAAGGAKAGNGPRSG
jgi:hypothetical protein